MPILLKLAPFPEFAPPYKRRKITFRHPTRIRIRYGFLAAERPRGLTYSTPQIRTAIHRRVGGGGGARLWARCALLTRAKNSEKENYRHDPKIDPGNSRPPLSSLLIRARLFVK